MQTLQINIEQIRQSIRELHKTFLGKLSAQIDKVLADRRLRAEISITKIKYILGVFKDERVIDVIEEVHDGLPYKTIRLSNSNNGNHVDVYTDGEHIIIKGSNYSSTLFNEPNGTTELIKMDLKDQSFDWNKFATTLLDYIHLVIYDRKRALETKIDGIFDSPSKKSRK